MLEDALLLAEIDVNGSSFRLTPVPLHSVVSKSIENASALAGARRTTFDYFPHPETVMGTEDLLVRAFQALLETAVKLAQPGEVVAIKCGADPAAPSVVIETCGGTIPEAVLEKFFDLFAMSEASTPAGHLGLGPAVAARILSLCEASLKVQNLSPSGVQIVAQLKGPL
jgi:K+-sensing histidine kinase KdpD